MRVVHEKREQNAPFYNDAVPFERTIVLLSNYPKNIKQTLSVCVCVRDASPAAGSSKKQ
jgi:hypothetical protein